MQKTPSTKLQTGPTLGEDTIRQAEIATMAAMAAVVAFMIVYYRFGGVVASFALLINLLLTLAGMILIKAAFTLTGVAGLALTLGMAVDANVLIYERIREEIARGATLRMAIRNGFERAMSAIVDSNLTTLITAVVLYVVGTDQIKGFAVTLTLGLLVSLFTAIFVSRVVLDVFEKQRWIKTMKFMQVVGITNIDFIGKWRICAIGTTAVILIGFVAIAARGKNMLDIDFLGGSSVQILFQEPHDIAEVRKTLSNVPADVKQKAREQLAVSLQEELVTEAKTHLGTEAPQDQIDQYVQQQLDELSELRDVAVSSVNLPGEAGGLRFQFNTSNRKIHAVETILKDLFPGELANNRMTFTPVAMVTGDVTPEPRQDAAKVPASPAQPSQPPAQPKENEGSAVSRGNELLLALADVGDLELALAQEPEPTAKTEEQKPAEPAARTETQPAGGEKQVAKTTLKFREKINHDGLAARLQEVLPSAGAGGAV